MRVRLLSLTLGSLVAGACANGPVDVDPLLVDFLPEDLVLGDDDAGDFVPGQYIVVMREGVRPLDLHHDLPLVRELESANALVLSNMDDRAVAELRADRDVLMVIPDAVAQISARPVASAPQVTPAGIDRVGADENANNGAGVTVCVIDTGIDHTHADLAGRYAGGQDFVNNDADAMDDNGHGTHVAGTIAATDDALGVVGVAPEATLIAAKVLSRRGSGSYSAITAGINYCVAQGAEVINMSLGGTFDDPTQRAALQAAKDAGVTIVVAAGNEEANLDTSAHFPANYDGIVITVSAAWVDEADRELGTQVAYPTFSNYGSPVDLSAPGVYVVSTKRGGGTTSMSGTSMACPHVAGGAALYVASHPGATPDQVEAALENGTENVNNVSVHPEEMLNVRGL